MKYIFLSLLFLFGFTQLNAQTKAVGLTMAGKHAVSGSGASTYSIPLSLPKGTAGMEPSLGLVYNSQGGEGPLGIGWNISGLGAITRTGKTLYHDHDLQPNASLRPNTTNFGLQLDGTDNLALDGQRLISTGSNEWMTEVAGFDKVSKAGNNAGLAPLHVGSFVVSTKNQQTIYYGSNPDSRQIAPGTGQVMAWYISKIEDAYGNYTEYQYNNDAAKGEVNISRISYTGNAAAGLSPYIHVNFQYAGRQKESFSKVAFAPAMGANGQPFVRQTQLLQGIEVSVDGQTYRRYELTYDTHERLTNIKAYNADNEYVESVFEWGRNDMDALQTNSNLKLTEFKKITGAADYNFYTSDFRGLGRVELLKFPDAIGAISNNQFWPLTSTFSASTFQLGTPNYTQSFHSGNKPINNGTYRGLQYSNNYRGGGWQMIKVRDVNSYFNAPIFSINFDGDGLEDFVYISSKPFFSGATNPNFSGANQIDLRICRNLPNGGYETSSPIIDQFYSIMFPQWQRYLTHDIFVPVDYDGDGRQEMFLVSSLFSANREKPTIIGMNSARVTLGPWTFNWPMMFLVDPFSVNGIDLRTARIHSSNFDADAATELLVACSVPNQPNQTRYVVFDFDVNWVTSSTPLTIAKDFIYNKPFAQVEEELGDFNGDGFIDIKTNYNDPNSFEYERPGNGVSDILFANEINCNTPGAGFQCVTGMPVSYSTSSCGTSVAADFNGDGLCDYLQITNDAVVQIRQQRYSFQNGQLISWIEEVPQPVSNMYSLHLNKGARVNSSGSLSIEWHSIYGYPIDFNMYPANPGTGLQDYDAKETQFGDFNGDGAMDLMILDKTINEYTIASFLYAGEKVVSSRNKIHTYTNHLGEKTKVGYSSFTQDGVGEMEASFSCSYPLMKKGIALAVVSSVEKEKGSDEQKTGPTPPNPTVSRRYNYTYKTPVFHLRGKGFLGFRSVTVEELGRYKSTTNLNEFDATYGISLPRASTTYMTLNSTLKRQGVENEYTIHPLGGGRIFPYPSKTTKTDNTNGPITIESIASTNSTDLQQGNINGSVTRYFRGSTLDETVETYSVYDYTGHWGGRVKIAHKSTTRGGQVSNEATGMTYNAQGSPIGKLDHYYLSAAEQVRTKYDYDAFGNNIFTQVEAQGLLPRDKHIEYDQQGRFEIASVNAMQHVHVQTVDPFTGQVTQRTDPNGLTTEMTYDNWGRNTMAKSPDGVKVMTEYLDAAGMTHVPGMGSSFLDRQAVYAIRQQTQGLNNAQVTFYNRHGRKLREVSKGFTGQDVLVDYEYDDWGRLSAQSEPYFSNAGGSPTKTVTEYDLLNRPTKVYATNGGQLTTIDYDNAYGVQSNTGTQFKKITKDATGKTIEQSDNGGTVKYTYHPNGKPSSVDAAGALTKLEYDARGFQTILNEPNSGVTEYRFNAFGELAWQKDSKPTSTSAPISTKGEYSMTYDVLGRLVHKHGNEGDYVTEYDPNNAKGQVSVESFRPSSPQFGQDVRYAYEYDNLARLEIQTEDLGGEVVQSGYMYDDFSRVLLEVKSDGSSQNYGVHIKDYNSQGYLRALYPFSLKGDANPLWECLERNAKGQATKERMANGLVTTRGYDVLGRPSVEQIKDGTSVFRHWQYTFDEPTGNLLNRTDVSRGLSEDFGYDNLDRLISVGGAQAQALTMNYAANGNITRKSDAALQFIYGNVQPHQVTEVRGLVPDFPLEEQTIEYTPFNSTSFIKEGASRYNIFYGPDEQRVKSVLERPDFDAPSQQLTQTRYYASNLEITLKRTNNGITKQSHYYINSDERNVAISEIDAEGAWNYYFVHIDYLGSPLLFTRIDKVVKEEHSHDAWGRYRNPDDWTYTAIQPELYSFARGYTGHEYLVEFGLVNMNGRCYDPLLGRMLGVDNFAHDDAGTQGHNRYSYVFNNPLKYTDGTGEEPITLTAIIVGAIIGAYLNGANANEGSFAFWNWKPNLRTFGYMVAGGVAGALGANWIAGGAMAATAAAGAAGMMSAGGTLLVDGISAATGGYAIHWGAKEWFSNSFNAFMAGATGAVVGGAAGNVQITVEQLLTDRAKDGICYSKSDILVKLANSFVKPFADLNSKSILEMSFQDKLISFGAGGLINSWGNAKNWRDGHEAEDAGWYFGIGLTSAFLGTQAARLTGLPVAKNLGIAISKDLFSGYFNSLVKGRVYQGMKPLALTTGMLSAFGAGIR